MPQTSRQKRLQSDIGEVLATTPKGTEWGVAVIDANRLRLVAGVNAGMTTEALSLSKVALAHVVAKQMARGVIHPDNRLPIETSDIRPGGFLGRTQGKLDPTVQEVLQATLRVSDTTGQRALTRLLGGPDTVNGFLHTLPPRTANCIPHPLIVTRLEPLTGESGPSARFYTGNTTPFEAALAVAAATNDPMVIAAMRQNIFGYGARWHLPGNTAPDPGYLVLLDQATNLRRPLAPDELSQLMHPSWELSPYPNMMGFDGNEGMWHDAVRIGDTVLAALSQGYPELPEDQEHPALDIHAQLGKLVFDYAQTA